MLVLVGSGAGDRVFAVSLRERRPRCLDPSVRVFLVMATLSLSGCGTDISFSEALRDEYRRFSADAACLPAPPECLQGRCPEDPPCVIPADGAPSYVSWDATLGALGAGNCLELAAVFLPEGAGLLRRVLGLLGSVAEPELPTAADRVAFWVNAYNALVVSGLATALATRPETSVADRDFAVLRTPKTIAGAPLAADWIAHGVLRGDFEHPSLAQASEATQRRIRAAHARAWPNGRVDPRVHFVLACGARSCPDLPASALRGEDLDAALDRLTRAFLADEVRGVGFDGVSALFHWYAADFRPQGGVPAFLARYGALSRSAPEQLLPWDWRPPPRVDPEACATGPTEEPSGPEGPSPEETDCSPGAVQPCGPLASIGACRPGESRCEEGRWGACVGAVEPAPERCDGVDEDCDGSTDEGVVLGTDPRPCPAEGVCRDAMLRCAGGAWVCDLPLAHEVAEASCDGLDNDCDGSTDEDAAPPANLVCTGPGLCAGGRPGCEAGAWVCVQPNGHEPGGERLCDGVDGDCDAVIDEQIQGCVCPEGTRRPCGSTVGACTEGEQVCDDGTWGTCGGITPREEVCDGVDNDCDGAVDDGVANACGGCGPAPLET